MEMLRKRRPEEVAEAREFLILRYCDLVKYIALRLVARLPDSVQVDDLFNAGIIGLIDAIDKFDVSQGIQFETYAKIRVRGAMLDEIRSMDWIPRSLRRKSSELEKACLALEQRLGGVPTDEQIVQELGIGVEEYHKLLDEIKGISLLPEDIHEVITENKGMGHLGTDCDELFDKTYRQEIKGHLTEAISTLAEKEQLVLALYYYEELTMKEIGAVLGYTESGISQIHTKAVLKLRVRLAKKRRPLQPEDLPVWCGKAEIFEPDPSALEFGQKIKRLRQEEGLTQTEVASRAECANSTLSNCEAGKVFPGSAIRVRILNVFKKGGSL